MNNIECTDQIVDINSTLAYVLKLLEKYDKNLEKGIIDDISPYYDKIFMQGYGNKTIEVPYDVQQEAIKKWNVQKLQISYGQEKNKIEKELYILNKQLEELNEDSEEDDSDEKNYMYILVVLIVILIVGFGMYMYRII